MPHYKKGANAERELIRKLWSLGFASSRIAGSGSTSLPAPDLIAFGKNKRLAFESKAWSGAYLSIPKGQMEELEEWCERADAQFYIAWKVPREGWLFLGKDAFSATGKNYVISKKKAESLAKTLGVVAGSQSTLR